MPDEPRSSLGRHEAAASPSAERPLQAFGQAISNRFALDPSLVRRGNLHVRAGVVAFGVGAATLFAVTAREGISLGARAATVVAVGALMLGILGSGRGARRLVAATGMIAAISLSCHAMTRSSFASEADMLASLGAALMAGGAWFATLSRGARAWHESRRAVRDHRKRTTSLQDWKAARRGTRKRA